MKRFLIDVAAFATGTFLGLMAFIFTMSLIDYFG